MKYGSFRAVGRNNLFQVSVCARLGPNCDLKFLKALALPLYMLLLSSIFNKDVLFIFSSNKVAAEEVPLWVPLEQKVVKDVHRLDSSTNLHN